MRQHTIFKAVVFFAELSNTRKRIRKFANERKPRSDQSPRRSGCFTTGLTVFIWHFEFFPEKMHAFWFPSPLTLINAILWTKSLMWAFQVQIREVSFQGFFKFVTCCKWKVEASLVGSLICTPQERAYTWSAISALKALLHAESRATFSQSRTCKS